ncbi:MAG: MarR family winged helix-turn-helix transcriptional regulator [Bacteroidota bacterium]|nr:MarR family winged helix-turn-helix transcriptional regulator [Bacteroidota bacterium]
MSNSALPNFETIQPHLCLNSKVRRLHKLMDAIYQLELAQFGLKGSMLSILFVIGKKPGISQRQIADYLVLDQSTISRDIKKLLGNGWISLQKSEDDPRASELSISESGLTLLEKIAPVWSKVHEKMAAHLGNYQIQALDGIIESVKKFNS